MNPRKFWGKFLRLIMLYSKLCLCLFIYLDYLMSYSELGSEVFWIQHLTYFVECRTLDKTISSLEMELSAARAAQESIRSGSPLSQDIEKNESPGKRKYLMVIGINTAFSSRKRRDSVRATWMPQGSYIYFLLSPS